MTVIGEERRRAIIAEVMAATPRRVPKEMWMFTAPDVVKETGERYARVMARLRQQVVDGLLKSEENGFDQETGRRVTLFWRPEDEPPQAG